MTEYSDSAYLYEALAHAEAVAARLVEVICEQDRAARDGQVLLSDAFKWQQMLTEERDAARADEGKRVHETLVALERERDAARAEAAALRDEVAHAWAVANGEAGDDRPCSG